MHLLAILALYISAISFGALLFQYIDLYFPDPLNPAIHASSAIRWALSSLVILFPVYVWTSWVTQKDAQRNPEKRDSRIRKWLFYFTLFLAAIIIIGDLIALIYNFLEGSLSTRFILKIFAVLFIAVSVFGYYLWTLRKERMASEDPRMRIFVFGVIGIVAIAIIGGFFVAGSPFEERLRRFDERRIQDLQTIQWQVVNYWQQRERLPENPDQLRDDISGFVPPRDPATGAMYGYRVLGQNQFELCATFDTEGSYQDQRFPGIAPTGELEGTWEHGAGEECFQRTIDPERYPPVPKR